MATTKRTRSSKPAQARSARSSSTAATKAKPAKAKPAERVAKIAPARAARKPAPAASGRASARRRPEAAAKARSKGGRRAEHDEGKLEDELDGPADTEDEDGAAGDDEGGEPADAEASSGDDNEAADEDEDQDEDDEGGEDADEGGGEGEDGEVEAEAPPPAPRQRRRAGDERVADPAAAPNGGAAYSLDRPAPKGAEHYPAKIGALLSVGQEVLGIRSYRPGQAEALGHILDDKDVLAVMPTGSGKSMLYQLPSLVSPGVTVVVSPLIALIKDQIDKMVAKGVAAARIDSTLTARQRRDVDTMVAMPGGKLLLTTPERMADPEFRTFLRAAAGNHGVSRFVVDEAHCVSQWGHDFRPAYLSLRKALEDVGRPPVLATTATAPPHVRADILHQLGIENAAIVTTTFDRPNLHYEVIVFRDEDDKMKTLVTLLRRLPRPGIVYAATVKKVEELYESLGRWSIPVAKYHGRMTKNDRDSEQQRFMESKDIVMVATNAFGLGVDKPDIRNVLHYHVPGSLEAYAQEAGRGGRDGKPARCVLLFSPDDVAIQEYFLSGTYPTRRQVKAVFETLEAFGASRGAEDSPPTIANIAVSSGVGAQRTRTVLSLLKDERFVVEREGGLFEIATPPPDPTLLAERARQYEARRIADRRRLDALLAYVKAPGCRNQVILEYLGETDPTPCGRCDNCLRSREVALAVATEATRLGAAVTRQLDDDSAEIVKPKRDIKARVVRIDQPAAPAPTPPAPAPAAPTVLRRSPAAAAAAPAPGPAVRVRTPAPAPAAPPAPAASAPRPAPGPLVRHKDGSQGAARAEGLGGLRSGSVQAITATGASIAADAEPTAPRRASAAPPAAPVAADEEAGEDDDLDDDEDLDDDDLDDGEDGDDGDLDDDDLDDDDEGDEDGDDDDDLDDDDLDDDDDDDDDDEDDEDEDDDFDDDDDDDDDYEIIDKTAAQLAEEGIEGPGEITILARKRVPKTPKARPQNDTEDSRSAAAAEARRRRRRRRRKRRAMLPPKSAFTTPVLSSPAPIQTGVSMRSRSTGPVVEYVRSPMRIAMSPVASANPNDAGADRRRNKRRGGGTWQRDRRPGWVPRPERAAFGGAPAPGGPPPGAPGGEVEGMGRRKRRRRRRRPLPGAAAQAGAMGDPSLAVFQPSGGPLPPPPLALSADGEPRRRRRRRRRGRRRRGGAWAGPEGGAAGGGAGGGAGGPEGGGAPP